MGTKLPGSYFFLLNYCCSHLHKALVLNFLMCKSVIFLCYTDSNMNIWFWFWTAPLWGCLFVFFIPVYDIKKSLTEKIINSPINNYMIVT